MFSFSLFHQLSCGRLRPLLARQADGRLTEAERALVAAHLDTCPDCRASLETVTRMGGLLRAHVPAAPEPSADLWSRVHAEITAETARPAPLASPRPALSFRPVFALPVAAVVAASAFAFISGGLRPQTDVSQTVAMGENVAPAPQATARTMETDDAARAAAGPVGDSAALDKQNGAAMAPRADSATVVKPSKPNADAGNFAIAAAPIKRKRAADAAVRDPFTSLTEREPANASERAPEVAWEVPPAVAKNVRRNSGLASARTKNAAEAKGAVDGVVAAGGAAPFGIAAASDAVASLTPSGAPLTPSRDDNGNQAGGIGGGAQASAASKVAATNGTLDAALPFTPKPGGAMAEQVTSAASPVTAMRGGRVNKDADSASRPHAIIDQNGFRVTVGARGQSPHGATLSAPSPDGAPRSSASAPRSAVDMATQIRRQRSLFQYAAPQQ